MEDVEIKVAFKQVTAADAMPLLLLAASDDVQGVGLSAVLDGCIFFMLSDHLAYALKRVGNELWIQAAGGNSPLDLTAIALEQIEAQAVGIYTSIGFQTRRRGLVKKAMRAGFVVDGYILRKKIKHAPAN